MLPDRTLPTKKLLTLLPFIPLTKVALMLRYVSVYVAPVVEFFAIASPPKLVDPRLTLVKWSLPTNRTSFPGNRTDLKSVLLLTCTSILINVPFTVTTSPT